MEPAPKKYMAVGVKTDGILFWGIGAPPMFEPILVVIGMFTGGTIWLLTHGHLFEADATHEMSVFLRLAQCN